MSFGSECSCSSPRRVSNFNSRESQGGIYPHIKFERDRLNTFRVKSVHVVYADAAAADAAAADAAAADVAAADAAAMLKP